MKNDLTDTPVLPMTAEEMDRLGWEGLDVILVSGDAYVDSPHIGVAVIGRVLLAAGYRVGIIAQPDPESGGDISRLGEPALFWGVTGGCVDSMVANYTASGKRRRRDDMTPGGVNDRRPDRAAIVYTNLIRRHFKETRPIVLGGIEASLRRVSHYDAWSGRVRRSILFDAKADLLVYGMGEKSVLEVAACLAEGRPVTGVRGICTIGREVPSGDRDPMGPCIELPSHEEVSRDREAFTRMFRTFYEHSDPFTARRLCQRQDTRFLIQNPPQPPLSPGELDRICELPYTRSCHPSCRKAGRVAALDTIRFSIGTHRGCYGECRFCAITVHQGRHVVSRSPDSILREARSFERHPDFKGNIPDVGGPTANMYGFECRLKAVRGACADKACLFPRVCKHLEVDHGPQIRLLRALRELPHVRKVFIGSGLRYDLILHDRKHGREYLEEVLRFHTSGQLKIAPEHVAEHVLALMGKPGVERLEAFLRLFDELNRTNPQKAFLTYYLMAAHPGSSLDDMRRLSDFAGTRMKVLPEQVQIFTPTPSTFSTLMYHTGRDPFSGEEVFVERNVRGKVLQKTTVTGGTN
ncbi:conserved hypothetical protein [uncultured Desulfatiglans sp.]|uniref:Radical SAM core domain-containing protein n=1 Tax=Uncultured Desulfatiglans sp. TaxID=1748965 RepID=A0A653A958_UNCDX|nr:conserved hypothetical protein [uncultured Desulfatiglans sp.]